MPPSPFLWFGMPQIHSLRGVPRCERAQREAGWAIQPAGQSNGSDGQRFLPRFQVALVLHSSKSDVDGAALEAAIRQLDHLQTKQFVVGRKEFDDLSFGTRKLRELLVHANDYRSYKQ